MKFINRTLLTIATGLTLTAANAQYGMGVAWPPNPGKQFKNTKPTSLGFSKAVPSSFSMKAYTPYVKSQGVFPSCSGWAVAYEAFSMMYARANGITNRNHITALAFDPYFVYNKVEPADASCSVGKDGVAMMILMKEEGCKKFYLPLMGCGKTIGQEFIGSTKNYKIKEGYIPYDGFKNLPADVKDQPGAFKWFFANTAEKDMTYLKQAIAEGFPLIISAALPNSFYNVYNTDIWEPTSEEKADPAKAVMDNAGAHRLHAMTVVGYDDNKYGGAFEVMNSWSEAWGNKGFFWIKYDDFKKFIYWIGFMELYPVDATTLTKTGCIWGDCNNGNGMYRFASGQTYEGQFSNGQYNGYGIYTWPEGLAYAGQWKNGLREGEATFYFVDGTFGQSTFVGDKLTTGYDHLTYADGGSYKGYLKNGKLDGYGEYRSPQGATYTGSFSNDNFNGIGKYTWTDGSVYVGYFQDGKRHGKGLWGNAAGKYYAGEWSFDNFQSGKTFGFSNSAVNSNLGELTSTSYLSADCASGNCLTGSGTRNMSNGNTYTGAFVDGLEQGFGKMNYKSGESYEGGWRQGKYSGVGYVKYADGEYIGEYKNEKLDGPVLLYDKSGNMSVLVFKDGNRISIFKPNAGNPEAPKTPMITLSAPLKTAPVSPMAK